MGRGSNSMLGESSTSFHGIEMSMVALLISFFTDVFVNILVLTGSEVDTFMILLLVLFLWQIIRSGMQSLSDITTVIQASKVNHVWEMPGEDEGWADAWAAFMDFVSRVLVILVFQFAARLILQEWTLAGVTTQETLVLLFLLGLIFFPIYLWIHRAWTAHKTLERKIFYQDVQRARQQAIQNNNNNTRY